MSDNAQLFYVSCDLENASESIDGIAFQRDADGAMITVDPVSEAVAKRFASIDGFTAIPVDPEALAATREAEERANALRAASKAAAVAAKAAPATPAPAAPAAAAVAPKAGKAAKSAPPAPAPAVEDTASVDGANGTDTLQGGGDNDSLAGGNDTDSLLGVDGDDSLAGGNDADTLQGGQSDDTVAKDPAGTDAGNMF